MPNAPLKHIAGSTVTTVVDPRFGTGSTPTQPSGWVTGGSGGGTSVGTTGDIVGQGFHVPPGSLSNLTAGMANHATERVEIAYFGDSTGDGSGPDAGQGGPPRRLRDLIHATGITNGGRGSMRGPTESYDPDHAVVVNNGWDGGGQFYDWPPMGASVTSTDGATMTLQGRGTAIRLIVGNKKGISYSVDGGAPVVIPDANGATCTYIGGLAEGLHTLTVTKTGSTERTMASVEFIRDAGVIVHQDSRTGRTAGHYSNYEMANKGAYVGSNAGTAAFGLGLTQVTTNGPLDYAAPPSPQRPNEARNVKAAIFALGINNMTEVTDADPNSEGMLAASKLAENAAQFIRMCQAAQADPIIVIPHFLWDPRGWRVAGRFKTALVSVAEAHSVAWCDYEIALRQAGLPIDTNPHRPQAEYNVEAQFLFDNVISHALPE